MKRISVLLCTVSLMLVACASPATTSAATQKEELQKANTTIATFKKKDSGIQAFFDRSYGYAVFPTVGKGGFGIGGAFGTGSVFRNNKAIGSAKLVQVSIGFQAGGQAYSEVIFFQTESAFRNFTNGNLKLSAQVSAVAIKEGAAASANFRQGIAVFTMAKGGLMYEATVAGQSFEYTPY